MCGPRNEQIAEKLRKKTETYTSMFSSQSGEIANKLELGSI
jgi:hypothetical protein